MRYINLLFTYLLTYLPSPLYKSLTGTDRRKLGMILYRRIYLVSVLGQASSTSHSADDSQWWWWWWYGSGDRLLMRCYQTSLVTDRWWPTFTQTHARSSSVSRRDCLCYCMWLTHGTSVTIQWVTSLFSLVRGSAFWLTPNTNLSARLWSWCRPKISSSELLLKIVPGLAWRLAVVSTDGTRSPPAGDELSARWCGHKDTSLWLTCNRTVAYLQPAYCVEATYLLQ